MSSSFTLRGGSNCVDLASKELLKSPAECDDDDDVTGWSNELIFCQSDFESRQPSLDLDQNDAYSCWKTMRWKSNWARHKRRSSP